MIALNLDVIFHTRERGDLFPTPEEALGVGEAIACWVDLFRLLFDVL
jgi:hypothetical protein